MSGICYNPLVLTKFVFLLPRLEYIFVPVLRSCLRDIYVSKWRAGLDMSSASDVFREIKLNFDPSSYLRSIKIQNKEIL